LLGSVTLVDVWPGSIWLGAANEGVQRICTDP